MRLNWIVAFFLLFCASANAQIVNTLPFQLQNGTTADATQVMADFNQIVNNVNANGAKNGSNSDITSLSGLTTPLSQAQGGTSAYYSSTATGTANAITVATLTPTGFTLTAGKRVVFKASATNTGATTLSANSTTATNIYKMTPAGAAALTGGEIVNGTIVEAVYDGTQYQLITNETVSFGPVTTLSSAATTDLGTIPSRNVSISGAVTITSFGSSASTSYPIYYLTFTGALTLTYNATSLILPGSANITTAANDTAVAQYLGSGNWQVLFYQRATGANIVPTTPLCGAINYTAANNTGTPDTQWDQTAAQAVMLNTGGVTVTRSSVSVTINATVNGANGLDTGSLASSTWYYYWLIDNGTAAAGLLSTSASSPTMPSGYTYKCLYGAVRTDGSSKFLRTYQKGAWEYNSRSSAALPIIVAATTTGDPTLGTYTAFSVANYVPSTAQQISLAMTASNSNAVLAPSSGFGANTSLTNPPPCAINTANTGSMLCVFGLEGAYPQSIYAALTNNGAIVQVYGWKNAVNAD